MRAARGILFGLAVAFGAVLPAFAENTGLKRLGHPSDILGWEAVGRLDFSGGYCTGVLIAPDLVLTAAHCIYDTRSGAERSTDKMRFRAGYHDGRAVAEMKVIRAVADPDYRPRGGTGAENTRHDVALLQLEYAIPSTMAQPFNLHSGLAVGQRVSVVSYGRGRSEALSRQKECGLLRREAGLMAFDCDVTHGSSGAPVFVRESGRARILSLISAGRSADGKTISFGMELPEIVASLKYGLRGARSSGLTASAGAKRITVGTGAGGKPTVRRLGNSGGAKFVRAKGN